ncbi:MAG TPA: EAL domain-containing protein [Candidatus Aquilonibacter sp.]|nr:EAL domain-containing protein [Candidatus Aquilonibacter sp.]
MPVPEPAGLDHLTHQLQQELGLEPAPVDLRQVEGREWWLWGFAVAVTLVLTFGILSLTFPGFHLPREEFYSLNLREWVRALAALVLLFDIYTVYQHLQLQRIRRHLAQREQLFQIITENAADMIAVVDRQGRRLYNSPAYEKMLGYSAAELAATGAIEQVHPDDRSRVVEAAEKAYLTGRGERLEYRIRHKDGSWRVLESTSSAIPGSDGGTEGLVIVNRDITERKRAEALLEHRAFHDGLTNLPNRALFLDRLQRAIGVSRRHTDFRFAVLFIDVDEFKVFNDSLGHAVGDDLLIQIARRLTACLRGADTVSRSQINGKTQPAMGENTLARPGGDEFVVLAEELRDAGDAIRICERIEERLAIPFDIASQSIVVTASIGIAFSNAGATGASDVLRDAEIAMYRAKRAGKARYEVFDTTMQADAVKRLQLETDLRRGLELDEFRVHYQPLVSLQSGRIVGFEALTRWQRPQGLIMPGEFIQVADENGLILSINRKLLREACEQLLRWNRMFPSDPPMAISANITAKQFAQPDLAAQIGEILQQTGVDPGLVDLEITENIAMADAGKSAIVLTDLKSLGVHLSIDDFGTGYSSLCRLQRFPVDSLKIDRTFVSGMDRDRETREIVRIIVMLAHNLGLKVVAEGIERREQMEMLKELGCEVGQGYLFSKPGSPAVIEELMANGLAPRC